MATSRSSRWAAHEPGDLRLVLDCTERAVGGGQAVKQLAQGATPAPPAAGRENGTTRRGHIAT